MGRHAQIELPRGKAVCCQQLDTRVWLLGCEQAGEHFDGWQRARGWGGRLPAA